MNIDIAHRALQGYKVCYPHYKIAISFAFRGIYSSFYVDPTAGF
jgi:hypothetical protein